MSTNGTHPYDATLDALYAWMPPQASQQPLYEAAASVNCHIMVDGRQVQLTLRDTDEARLLVRLQAVLQQYPVLPSATGKEARPPAGEGKDTSWCALHNVAMKENHKEGRTWLSHPTDQGWCKGR